MATPEGSRSLYAGGKGYVQVDLVTHNGQTGALLSYINPDPRKLHAVDVDGLREMEEGFQAVEQVVGDLRFLIMYGAYDPVHAGADITQFAADCDYEAINIHLHRGTVLDVRVKQLWPKLRTVSIMCGDRYGGSVEWPLFAEWSVCDSQTRLQFSEVHLGIIPGWNGILNVMLKSNALNAEYMGQTGNAVNAADLQRIGLVQTVVEITNPPDRRRTPPEEWEATWAAHAAEHQQLLIEAALDLATQPDNPVRITDQLLATQTELATEVARRLDRTPYVILRDGAALAMDDFGIEPDPIASKELIKDINKQLAMLGKPLGPESVAGVAAFCAKWGGLAMDELLADYAAAAAHEETICAELMRTVNRRIGINAVLSKNPLERVAVFE